MPPNRIESSSRSSSASIGRCSSSIGFFYRTPCKEISADQWPVRDRKHLQLIAERLPASLSLALAAFVLSMSVGIPLGVLAAVKRGTALDTGARVVALLGQSVPAFWLGIVLMYFFSVQLGWLPTSGSGTFAHLVLPAISMGVFTIAAITRLVRVSMIDALGSEYVKLARIKGVPEHVVVWKHALRNSLIPVLTYMGTFFATMITGAVVIEAVFSWPGIGRLAYESILNRDFPVMQAVVLVMTLLFMLRESFRRHRVCVARSEDQAMNVMLRRPSLLIATGVSLLFVLIALLAPWLAPHDPAVGILTERLLPPAWVDGGSSTHLFGTDILGRDILSRLLYGARISLAVCALAILIAGCIGSLLASWLATLAAGSTL